MSNKKVGIAVPSSLGSGLSFASTIKDRLENIYGYDVMSYPVENVEYQKNAMDAITAWGADHMIVWPCLPADAVAEKLAYFYEQGGKSFVIREYVSGVSGYCKFVMPDYFAAGVRLGYAFISAFDFENLGDDLTTADLTDVQKRYIYIALAGNMGYIEQRIFNGMKSVLNRYEQAGILEYVFFLNVDNLGDFPSDCVKSAVGGALELHENAAFFCFSASVGDLLVDAFSELGVNPIFIGYEKGENTQTHLDEGDQALAINENVLAAAVSLADFINDYDENQATIDERDDYFGETVTDDETITGIRISFSDALQDGATEPVFPSPEPTPSPTPTPTPSLTGITVTKLPKKIFYRSGDRLNVSDVKGEAEYSDGEKTEVSLRSGQKSIRFKKVDLVRELTLTYGNVASQNSPRIKVYKQNGIINDNSIAEQDMGAAGKGELNLYDCTLKYRYDDFYRLGGSLPIGVFHVYDADVNENLGFGRGWRTNFNQEVKQVDYVDGAQTTVKWEYTNKVGKKYYFDEYDLSEGESQAGRSRIRNVELGFDLFVSGDSSQVTLVDRSGNSILFEVVSGGKYRLKEVHRYPSTVSAPLPRNKISVEYTQDGKLYKIYAGKTPNGYVPAVKLEYSDGYLSRLLYNEQADGGSWDEYATYEYFGGNLLRIRTKEVADIDIQKSVKFLCSSASFEVKDENNKDSDGNEYSIIYSFGATVGLKRVSKISIGYKADEACRKVTLVRGGTHNLNVAEPYYVTGITELECAGKVTTVAFNRYCEVARYAYEKGEGGDFAKIASLGDYSSNGFDYKAFVGKYSDDYSLIHDGFEDGVCGWSGGVQSDEAFVFGAKSLKAEGKEIVREIVSDKIVDGDSAYASLWVKGSSPVITVTVEREGADVYAVPFGARPNVGNKWQFVALGVGGLKRGDKIKVKVKNDSVGGYVDEFRLTRVPVEANVEIPDDEYNAVGNATKKYSYDNIAQALVCVQTDYASDGITKNAVTVTRGGQRVSRKEFEYNSGGQVVSEKTFGKGDGYAIKTFVYGASGFLQSETDENGVVVLHNEGTLETTAEVCGETGSPSILNKEIFFDKSDRLKQSVALKKLANGEAEITKNVFAYKADGSIDKVRYNLVNGQLSSVLSYVYDDYGNVKEVWAGEQKLAEYLFNDFNLVEKKFADGECEKYAYDGDDRLISIKDKNDVQIATVIYDEQAEKVTTNHFNGVTYEDSNQNSGGRTAVQTISFSGESEKLKISGEAVNAFGNVTSVVYERVDGEISSTLERVKITKDSDGMGVKVERTGVCAIDTDYEYDEQSRLNKKTNDFTSLNATFETAFTYSDDGNIKGTRVNAETFKFNGVQKDALGYEYYVNGNVKCVTCGGVKVFGYEYDEQNRLVTEYDYANAVAYRYFYDNNGNILNRKAYNVTGGVIVGSEISTDGYTYDGDKLTAYNGLAIVYDTNGNPTNYKGLILEWKGNRLKKIGNVVCEYDINGLRVKKGDTKYYWQGKKLIAERLSDNGTEIFVYYRYDESGVCGMNYGGTEYYFRKNIFGDVVEVFTASGTSVAQFGYNAFGKVTTSSGVMANKVPFRYRGYYYDNETGFYYLQSRYYDSNVGRFISPDADEYLLPASTKGLNLYAYCENNPVMGVDPGGNFSWLIFAALLLFTPIGGTALQFATSVVSYVGMAVFSIFDEEVRNDMNAIKWNPFNADESKVGSSQKVSFYKGVPVIVTECERSCSFGAIFLTKGSDEDTLRHERGHNWQLMMMGVFNYAFSVGIPSPLKLGGWSESGIAGYYKAPWETLPDILGGVKGRSHTEEEKQRAWKYYLASVLLSIKDILYYWF